MKPWCVTIQLKAIEQYFLLVLFIMMCEVILTLKSLWMKPKCVTIQLQAIEQYFMCA